MNREAIDKVIAYCEQYRCPVQITFDGENFIVDFKHDRHARDINTVLVAQGFYPTYNPTIDGTQYYARLA